MGFADANALLNTGGSPIAKFQSIGDQITGYLVDAEVAEQTDPQGNVVRDDRTGKAKLQIIYTLQTDERDPNLEDDDGKRRVFAKWAIQAAITEALRAKGLEKQGLQEGGKLTVTHTSTKPAGTRGFSDMKLFAAEYEAPGPKGLPSSTTAPASSQPTDFVGKYGAQAVDMAVSIYNGAPETPLVVIAQATKIPETDLRELFGELPF